MKFFSVPVLAMIWALGHTAQGQTAPAAPNPAAERSIGEVVSVDTEARQIVLKEDKGGELVVVSLTDKTLLLHVPPGETDIKKATKITLTDVEAGDRLLAVGPHGDGGKTAEARTIVIMTKSDLAQKQAHDQEEWDKHGISGTVAAVDSGAKTFTVTVGDKKYTVQATDQTQFRRYASDSAKFADSKQSTIAELKAGDQIRAKGDKSDEALTLKADEVISGTFVRMAATIKEMNASEGQIKVTELGTKKAYTIVMTPRSTARQLPPQIATMIARRLTPAPAGREGAQNGGPGGRGGRGGPGGFRANNDLNQILDRLPAVALADLKPGSIILVSGTPGTDSGRVTALALLSGVEAITTTVPAANVRDLLSGWNLGGGGGGGGDE
jgi:hypothetical protein